MPIPNDNRDLIWQFIAGHQHLPVSRVALLLSKKKHLPAEFILNQINGRQKAKEKIPSFINNGFIFPPKINMEQCSSEMTAQYKQSLIGGTSLLDLTMGYGVDTIFLAQKFSRITAVEPDTKLANIVEYNLQQAGLSSSINITNQTAEEFLRQNQDTFDWVYIDPSRRSQHKTKVVDLKKYSPDVPAMLPHLFRFTERVMIKISPVADLTYLYRLFSCIDSIHIVAVKNECKEILVILNHHLRQNSDKVVTVNLLPENSQYFAFNRLEETNDTKNTFLKNTYTGHYFYLPNAAVNKAQGYNALCKKYNLQFISNNTHLFIGDKLISGFPGSVFRFAEAVNPKKMPVADYQVILKNYPLSHAAFLKKYKLSTNNASDNVLLGFRDAQNKVQHLLLQRIRSQSTI